MRIAALIAAGLVAIAVLAELATRALVGFPLLYIPHPATEYMAAPNQSGSYRGIAYATNAWGMRGAPIEEHKPDGVFRVAVVGDSVVFGHSITNQDALTTTQLSARALGGERRVEALNISANGWGPGNQLAFVENYGLFGADTAILVASTHDLDDDRSFAPLAMKAWPTRRMPLALLDWINRRNAGPVAIDGAPQEDMTGDARRSLPALLGRLRAPEHGACLVLHETRDERTAPDHSAAIEELTALAKEFDIPAVFTRDHVDLDTGFADDIHLTPAGQDGLLAAMLACPALSDIAPSDGAF